MDLLRFIDSKDVSQHLENIHYQFTTPEAAFLIYCCHHATLKEKFAAWQEIIDTMPDCSMKQRYNMIAIDSFHHFLKEYLDLQRKILKMFYESEGAVYTYETYENLSFEKNKEYEWCESKLFFPNFETCFSHYKKQYADNVVEKSRFIKYMIVYSDNEERGKSISVEMNSEQNIISLTEKGVLQDSELDIDLAFEGM